MARFSVSVCDGATLTVVGGWRVFPCWGAVTSLSYTLATNLHCGGCLCLGFVFVCVATHALKSCMCCFAVAFLLQRQPTELQPPIGGHRTAQRRLGQAQPAACVPSVLEDALHPSVASHPLAIPGFYPCKHFKWDIYCCLVVKLRSDPITCLDPWPGLLVLHQCGRCDPRRRQHQAEAEIRASEPATRPQSSLQEFREVVGGGSKRRSGEGEDPRDTYTKLRRKGLIGEGGGGG